MTCRRHLAVLSIWTVPVWAWLVTGCAGFPEGDSEPFVHVERDDALAIGRKIWQNECNGTVEGLTSWNRGEDFASLGIGHFIWYPKGKVGPFDESWPKLVAFFKERNVGMPEWIVTTADCPWDSHEAFHAARDTARMRELRSFLASSMEAQTEFIIHRLRGALPKMKAAVTAEDREKLERNFQAVAGSRSGLYALIDYVNFKGEGVKPEERYQGEGWGLTQVLLDMEGEPAGDAAAVEFGRAAARVLTRRVRNAPTDESRWLEGWKNRCTTYGQPV